MKSLKDNSIVKWVYAYVDLLLKVLPFVFVSLSFPLVANMFFFGFLGTRPYDFFYLFGSLGNAKHLSITWLIAIPSFNIVVFILLFLALRRLVVFVKNVLDEKPFEEENGINLIFVGKQVIALTIISHIASILSIQGDRFFKDEILNKIFGFLSIALSPYLFSGLLLIVIGEVILHGVRMKQEIDLTV